MRTIIKLFICHLFIFFQFLPIDVTFANEWGLEKQNMAHGKCDSIILHYDGEVWNTVYHGFNMWLNDIFGFEITISLQLANMVRYSITMENRGKSKKAVLLQN